MKDRRLNGVFLSSLILLFGLYFGVFSDWTEPVSESVADQYGRLISRVVSIIDGRPAAIVFVGDVLLARDVAKRIDKEGIDHPFAGSSALFKVAYVVGNFEAAVPEVHEPEASKDLRFSVDPDHLESLVNARFTHLSLANNHSFDFGEGGLQGAKDELELRGITALGRPDSVSSSSLAYLDLSEVSVALLTLNAVGGYPDEAEWRPILVRASFGSQFQVVYIHWGEEYQLGSAEGQQQFARELIEAGADLVVGHHPHVVQEIEQYENGLIIYSLGNFVFDQYFSLEVQRGLAVKLSFEKDRAKLELLPVTSEFSPAQPVLMAEEMKTEFLTDLASRSNESLREEIKSGQLKINWNQ